MGGQGHLTEEGSRPEQHAQSSGKPSATQRAFWRHAADAVGTSLPAAAARSRLGFLGVMLVEGTEALSSVDPDLRELAAARGCPAAMMGRVDCVCLVAGRPWCKHGKPQKEAQHQMSTPRIGLAAVYAPQVQAVEPPRAVFPTDT